MLTLVSGPFFPYLENELLKRIAGIKAKPLAPVLVVAPTQKLIDHLQLRLGAGGKSYLNLHWHSLSSLAEDLVTHEGPLKKPAFSDSVFFDTLVRFLIKEKRPFRHFDEMALPEGFSPAVRSTLKDLIEAGVPPDVYEAVKEGFLGAEVDVGVLRELLLLHSHYLSRVEGLPFVQRSTIQKLATEQAATSKYLAEQSEILFYGFYDFTGMQADFFQAVARVHPVRMFFPYEKGNPAYDFARRFRDEYLQASVGEEISFSSIEGRKGSSLAVEIASVSGLHDEAWWVAQKITELHEMEKIPYSEICVVARSKDRTRAALPWVFGQWNIPVRDSWPRGLREEPVFARAVERLDELEMKLANTKRTWDEWIALMKQELSSLKEDKTIVLQSPLDSLASYSLLSSKVSFGDFAATLRRKWEETDLSLRSTARPGVTVTHVEGLRGLQFKVVFALGIEEKVFPRVVREDPFLRDNARLALRNTLGYKIPLKLSGLEEERLLFHFLTTAASERLALVFQRTDNEGRVVGPSQFLFDYLSQKKLKLDDLLEFVPRSTAEKLRQTGGRVLSQREETLRYLFNSQKTKAIDWVKLTSDHGDDFERGLGASEQIESFGEPGAFDGILGTWPADVLFRRGLVSPTAIEIYGRCAFQYFGRKVLGLEEKEEFDTREGIPPDVKGLLIHQFLEEWFKPGRKSKDLGDFDKVFDAVFPPSPQLEWQMPALWWKAVRSGLHDDLKNYVTSEHAALEAEGWTPTYFEEAVAATLPAPLDRWSWTGSIDRVDVKGDEVRIVDYKSGRLPSGSILSEIFAGRRLQPAIYLLLAEHFFNKNKREFKSASFSYHKIGKPQNRKHLTDEDWTANKEGLTKAIKDQLALLEQGVFVIQSDTKICSTCELQTVCRRFHSATVARSTQGLGERLAELRERSS